MKKIVSSLLFSHLLIYSFTQNQTTITTFLLEADKAMSEAVSLRLRASFAALNFRREVISAWLNFYVLAQTVPEAKRLLRIYQNRLHANLVHDLRKLIGVRAEEVAQGLAAMIDGVYIREALKDSAPDGVAATAMALEYLTLQLESRA